MNSILRAACASASMLLLSASVCWAATYKSSDVVIEAPEIEFTSSGVTARGGAHMERVDPKTKDKMVADCGTIVIILARKAASNQADSIKQAEMKSNVRLKYSSTDSSGSKWNADSTSDNAVYTTSDQLARLTGKVVIHYTNPALFDGPAVVTGDKATVNTKPTLAEGEARFRIESAPGLSRVEVTPKRESEETK
jgi:hypothetical protein